MELHKEFVPHEQALDLKDLGFDEPCFGIFYPSNKNFRWSHVTNKGKMLYQNNTDWKSGEITAPTFSQAFKWFRDNHNLHVEPIWDIIDSELIWFYSISEIGNLTKDCIDLPHCKTPDEAEFDSLKKLIEIVKAQKS